MNKRYIKYAAAIVSTTLLIGILVGITIVTTSNGLVLLPGNEVVLRQEGAYGTDHWMYIQVKKDGFHYIIGEKEFSPETYRITISKKDPLPFDDCKLNESVLYFCLGRVFFVRSVDEWKRLSPTDR